MRGLWRASIWHPGAIPWHERKYASPLKRVVFPVYDIIIVLVGLVGSQAGVAAISQAIPDPGPAFLYGGLMVAGAVCFVGCAFPRLWVAEIIGKSVILTSLILLLGAMLAAPFRVEGYTGLTFAPVIGMMILVPLLRLWILGIEMAERRRPPVEASWSG